MTIYNVSGTAIELSDTDISGIFAETHLIAHKGGNVGSPNTIAAFKNAISNGYKMLEGDVRFTSDTVPVLSHDASVSGYTIASYTYDALKALVPTLASLEEFLILCKTQNVVAELDFTKEYSDTQITTCYNTVKKCGMTDRTMITTYDSAVRKFLAIDKNVIVCVSDISTTAGVDAISDIISNAKLCVCSTDYTAVTKSLVEYMHTAGCLSKPWTVNTVAMAETLFGYGADYIITDSVKPSELWT